MPLLKLPQPALRTELREKPVGFALTSWDNNAVQKLLFCLEMYGENRVWCTGSLKAPHRPTQNTAEKITVRKNGGVIVRIHNERCVFARVSCLVLISANTSALFEDAIVFFTLLFHRLERFRNAHHIMHFGSPTRFVVPHITRWMLLLTPFFLFLPKYV